MPARLAVSNAPTSASRSDELRQLGWWHQFDGVVEHVEDVLVAGPPERPRRALAWAISASSWRRLLPRRWRSRARPCSWDRPVPDRRRLVWTAPSPSWLVASLPPARDAVLGDVVAGRSPDPSRRSCGSPRQTCTGAIASTRPITLVAGLSFVGETRPMTGAANGSPSNPAGGGCGRLPRSRACRRTACSGPRRRSAGEGGAGCPGPAACPRPVCPSRGTRGSWRSPGRNPG
jgi:hypothetical protein